MEPQQVQQSNQLPEQQPTSSPTPPPSKKRSLWFVLVCMLALIVLILGGFGVWVMGRTSALQPNVVTNVQPTAIPTIVEPSLDITDWKTYTHTSTPKFSIRYPKTLKVPKLESITKGEWFAATQSANVVFFQPKGFNDGPWYIAIMTPTELLNHNKDTGSQFADRKEQRDSIIINGHPATLITVTTQTHPDWISKSVLIEKDKANIVISNGAIDMPEFEQFYNSFRFE